MLGTGFLTLNAAVTSVSATASKAIILAEYHRTAFILPADDGVLGIGWITTGCIFGKQYILASNIVFIKECVYFTILIFKIYNIITDSQEAELIHEMRLSITLVECGVKPVL